MVVPNFVPDPIEVPGNVTQERYLERLAFVRRVSLLHLAGIAAIALLVEFLPLDLPLQGSAIALCLLLLGLNGYRTVCRGSRAEVLGSVAFLPLILMLCAAVASGLIDMGWPVWTIPLGVLCAAVYAISCGRDFSFVGQFLLALIASSVAAAWALSSVQVTGPEAARGLVLNAGVLAYFIYDMAALLARRRRGEELGAVVDLYRDVFNFLGYTVRVLRHWRQHRIWVVPRYEDVLAQIRRERRGRA